MKPSDWPQDLKRKFRLAIAISAVPTLYKCGEWTSVEKFCWDCQGLGYFYMIGPDGGVVTNGSIPGVTFLRSQDHVASYFFYRDLGSFFSIDDGKYIIDVAAVCMPDQGLGLDVVINGRGFDDAPVNIPIVIWHSMFWALKNNRWKDACMTFGNLFTSDKARDVYIRTQAERFLPSVLKRHIEEDVHAVSYVTNSGLKLMVEEAQATKKYDKLTILWGARMNRFHNVDLAFNALHKLFMIGVEFDLVVTTQNGRCPPNVARIIKEMGAELHLECSGAKYREIMRRSHIVFMTGEAEAPTYAAEGFCNGAIPLFEQPQYNFDVVRQAAPGYEWVFRGEQEAVGKLAIMCREYARVKQEFDAQEYAKRFIEAFESGDSSQSASLRSLDVFRSYVKSHRRLLEVKPPTVRQMRYSSYLSMLGNEATLEEVCAKAVATGSQIKTKKAGKYATRHLIHSALIGLPWVYDQCDDEEPRYVMDFDAYSKALEEWQSSEINFRQDD